MNLVGREREQAILDQAARSGQAELIAVYGRRRVGKTFLIRQHLGARTVFELTGLNEASSREQLENFALALGRSTRAPGRLERPENWIEAFRQLTAFLEGLKRGKEPRIVFFDELPWLATRRSGFLPAFEHFWNSWASRQRQLIVVVCGSAASWMLKHVIEARGGLHNRVTRRLRLLPLSLSGAQALLQARRIDLGQHQVMELYMALGGIPYYLAQIERGESAAQAIDRLCFSEHGALRNEFPTLYASLFEHSGQHMRIVRALANKPGGMSRNELLKAAKLPSGGASSDVLAELIECGFVMQTPQFGKATKDALYRLSDEYSLFYLRWIERTRTRTDGSWLKRRGTPAWRAWAGLAFEAMCLKHVDALKAALGIAGVESEESGWRVSGNASQAGAQIDLLIDRKDDVINACEMKFVDGPFVIDKRYAELLRRKLSVFRERTGTRKALLLTFITSHGVVDNPCANELVAAQLPSSALFHPR